MRYVTKTDFHSLRRTICDALRAEKLISNDDYEYNGAGSQRMYRFYGVKIDLNCHHPILGIHAPESVKRARELLIVEVVERVLKVAGLYTDQVKVRFTNSQYRRSELAVYCKNNKIKAKAI